MMERLHKILARAGRGSRRHCEELIRGGHVLLDGEVVRRLGIKADPEKSDIICDGERVVPEKKVYYIVNKPRGYISSNFDEKRRPCVTDLIPHVSQRLFAVGRLDIDSEGLMVLTNDGDLANRIVHPRYNVTKTYLATVAGPVSASTVSKIKKGVWLGELKTAPCKVSVKRKSQKSSLLEITLLEGLNREIRRMFAKFGHPVLALKRVKMGSLTLGDLPVGKYKRTSRTALVQKIGIDEDAPAMAKKQTDIQRPKPRPRNSRSQRRTRKSLELARKSL